MSVAKSVEWPPASVVVFFPDGMDRGRMMELIARGKLPNIERIFVRGGVGVECAITSIPALTYPNATSLMTGLFPGHHDIVGNQWFDRRTLESPDYITVAEFLRVNRDLRRLTLFEALPDHLSANIQCPVRRGCTHDVDTTIPAGIGWFLGLHINVDQYVGGCAEQICTYANHTGKWPALVVFYFPGLDETAHTCGPDTSQYEQAMHNIDCQVGRINEAISRTGMGERTHYVLVSDHGHPSARGAPTVDVLGWLRGPSGLRVHEGPIGGGDRAARRRFADQFDAIAMNGSYRRLAVHLRGASGWGQSPSPRRVQSILAPSSGSAPLWMLEGVGLVCVPLGRDHVQVFSRRGPAIVERRREPDGPVYRLRPGPDRGGRAAAADPLEYAADPELRSFVEAGWHRSRAWLAATAKAKYPDFVPQIVEHFDSPRAGDFVVFAEQGWVFAGHGPGEHGTVTNEDMLIPLYFTGPGLPSGKCVPCARIVDVMPTIVELLAGKEGLARIRPLDGVSLLAEIKTAAGQKP